MPARLKRYVSGSRQLSAVSHQCLEALLVGSPRFADANVIDAIGWF
jgi:hypothetical protein